MIRSNVQPVTANTEPNATAPVVQKNTWAKQSCQRPPQVSSRMAGSAFYGGGGQVRVLGPLTHGQVPLYLGDEVISAALAESIVVFD